MKLPKITSLFAILDVKRGRKSLERAYEKEPQMRIPVIIFGELAGPHSRDDGESIEFQVIVSQVDLLDPKL